MEDSLNSEISIKLLASTDDLGTEGSLGTLSKGLVVVLGDVQIFLDFINTGSGNITSALKSISNLEWMDSFFQKFLSLLENSSSKDHNTSGSIADLVILGC